MSDVPCDTHSQDHREGCTECELTRAQAMLTEAARNEKRHLNELFDLRSARLALWVGACGHHWLKSESKDCPLCRLDSAAKIARSFHGCDETRTGWGSCSLSGYHAILVALDKLNLVPCRGCERMIDGNPPYCSECFDDHHSRRKCAQDGCGELSPHSFPSELVITFWCAAHNGGAAQWIHEFNADVNELSECQHCGWPKEHPNHARVVERHETK